MFQGQVERQAFAPKPLSLCNKVQSINQSIMSPGRVIRRWQFRSVQFKMVSMHSKKSICAPPCLSEVSPTLPLKWFQCSSDWPWPVLVLSVMNSGSDSVVLGIVSHVKALKGCCAFAFFFLSLVCVLFGVSCESCLFASGGGGGRGGGVNGDTMGILAFAYHQLWTFLLTSAFKTWLWLFRRGGAKANKFLQMRL